MRLDTVKKFIERVPITILLEISLVPFSTWYKSLKVKKEDQRKYNRGRYYSNKTKTISGDYIDDKQVVEILRALKELPEFHTAGGYKKMKHYLYRHYSVIINHKKVYRLCKEHNLLLPPHKKKFKSKSPISINRVITRPCQLWEIDIKYAFIYGENKFFYVMPIIDVYLRHIVNYHIGLRCTSDDLVRIVKDALLAMDIKERLVIRTDNGPQMISEKFNRFISQQKDLVTHELIPLNTPNKNAHIESFNSILETEFFTNRYFNNYKEAYSQTVDFISFYTHKRVHCSLKFKTPFEALCSYKQNIELNFKKIYL